MTMLALAQEAAADASAAAPAEWFNEDRWFSAFVIVFMGVALYVFLQLILVALVLYQSPELLSRLRTSRAGVGRLQADAGEPSP